MNSNRGEIPKKNRIDAFALSWANVVLCNKWKTILVSLLVSLVFAAGLGNLDVSNNYRVFFSNSNPDLAKFEQFESTYTKNDNFLIVVKPRSGNLTNQGVMAVLEEITAKAWHIPYAIRVDSISNFQHTYASEDELIVEDLFVDALSLTDEEIHQRLDIAVKEPLLVNRLISKDKTAAGINITLQYPNVKLTELAESMNATRDLVKEFENRYPALQFAITGVSALNGAFGEATITDAKTLFGPMFLLLIFVTWVIFRSVSATIATVKVILLATLTAMGFAGWVGMTVSPFSGSAPVVILTLAIADSIHILMTVTQRMREGDNKLDAIRESVKVNFLAVSITSLTTIIGFLALNFSDAPPFNVLGNISAAGIAAAWFYSLTFFPAILAVMPLKVASKQNKTSPLNHFVSRSIEWVIARPKATLYGSMVVLIGLCAALPNIQLDDQWIEYFDHRVEFRGDAEFARDNLTGLYVLEYSVPAHGKGAVNDPDYLNQLESFTLWLRQQPEVNHVYSYTDIIKRLNKNMNFDNEDYYRLPDNREMAAQYLLLYEMSLPFGLDMNDRINIDKSSTRVTVTLNDITTKETRVFLSVVEQWWQKTSPQHEVYATGATYLFSFISQHNIEDMMGGNLIAVVLIALIMIRALNSVKYGLLSLVPNIVPIVMTFGLWGLLVGQIGMAAATVSATSLGIIVDNTVHLLTKYLRARQQQGLNAVEAIRYSYQNVGTAVAANALILTIGFSVLALSSFRITAEMGILTSIAILMALIVDFFMLPAILLRQQDNNASTSNSGEDHETSNLKQAA